MDTLISSWFLRSAVLLAFLLPGCSSGKGEQAARTVPVVTAQAELQTVPLQINAVGNVEAYNSVQIKPLVGGEWKESIFGRDRT